MEQIKKILAQAPLDMGNILRMADQADLNGAGVLIAGGANARVLMLLDGIGMGKELSAVQQPCVIVCRKSESLSILLHSREGSIKCSSITDLAQRLTWAENRGAMVEMGCPGDLLGKEKLIFAILDGENYRAQLNAHALGCSGAMIVLDAMEAPAMEVYQFAKWLADVCAMQNATSVLVCGDTDTPNCAPAMVMAMQMSMTELPVITCNTAKENLAEKMASGMINAASSTDGAGIAKEMVCCALKRLADEREYLAGTLSAPARVGLSLAERFEAQVPGTRVKIKRVISAEQANFLNADVRDFSIFLQKHIEEVLLAAISELDQPKEAMRAFAQGYLSHVLSDYCSALLGDMVQKEVAPQLQKCYEELLDAAWIRQAIDAQQLPTTALDCFDMALERVGFNREWLVNAVVNVILKLLIASFAPELAWLSRLLSSIVTPLVEAGQFKLTKPESYARQKGKMLKKALDEVTGNYQAFIRDAMLPQIESEILYWFDEHVKGIAEALRTEDKKIAGTNAEKLRKNQETMALIEKIQETEEALRGLA